MVFDPMTILRRALVFLMIVQLLVACEDPECGTMRIATVGDDEGFDPDADGIIELTEVCGTALGSTAVSFEDVGVTRISWAWSTTSVDHDVTVADRWAPSGSVKVSTERLASGETIDASHAFGSFVYSPDGEAAVASLDLSTLALRLIEDRGPPWGDPGGARVLALQWSAAYVDSAAPPDTPPGAVLEGSDDIAVSDSGSVWDTSWDGPVPD